MLFTPLVLLNPINTSTYRDLIQILRSPTILYQSPLDTVGMDSWDVLTDLCYPNARPGWTSALCKLLLTPLPWDTKTHQQQIRRVFIFSEAAARVWIVVPLFSLRLVVWLLASNMWFPMKWPCRGFCRSKAGEQSERRRSLWPGRASTQGTVSSLTWAA